MKIILIRHGETIWNSEKRYQGHGDSPLNDIGKTHAHKAGQLLNCFKIDRLYSSPLGRALSTAKIVANENSCEINIDSLLKELHYGIFEGKTRDEINKQFPEEMKKRGKDRYNYCSPEGESIKTLNEKRVKPFIEKLFKENKKDTVIVIVSHSGVNRLLITNLLGLNKKKVIEIYQSNDCVYSIETEGKGKKGRLTYELVDSGEKGEGYLRVP